MKKQEFDILRQKINNPNKKDLIDCDFENADYYFKNYDSVWFQFDDGFSIKINDNKVKLLNDNEDVVFRIIGETAEKWVKFAETFFTERFEEEIQDARYSGCYYTDYETGEREIDYEKFRKQQYENSIY